MRLTRRIVTKLAVPLAGAAVAVSPLAAVTAAHASDDFFVETTDTGGCGGAWFIDYGPGAEGGGSNDDYVEIDDYCTDFHGVKAWAWLTRNGTKYYLGGMYDGNGSVTQNHPPVIWDPFKAYGNVITGDYVGLKVCLVDGSNDATPSYCFSKTERSADG